MFIPKLIKYNPYDPESRLIKTCAPLPEKACILTSKNKKITKTEKKPINMLLVSPTNKTKRNGKGAGRRKEEVRIPVPGDRRRAAQGGGA